MYQQESASIDVFTLSETWLKPSVTNAEINIPNYLITRKIVKIKLEAEQLFTLRRACHIELAMIYAVDQLKHVGLKSYDHVRNRCLFAQPIDRQNFH